MKYIPMILLSYSSHYVILIFNSFTHIIINSPNLEGPPESMTYVSREYKPQNQGKNLSFSAFTSANIDMKEGTSRKH